MTEKKKGEDKPLIVLAQNKINIIPLLEQFKSAVLECDGFIVSISSDGAVQLFEGTIDSCSLVCRTTSLKEKLNAAKSKRSEGLTVDNVVQSGLDWVERGSAPG